MSASGRALPAFIALVMAVLVGAGLWLVVGIPADAPEKYGSDPLPPLATVPTPTGTPTAVPADAVHVAPTDRPWPDGSSQRPFSSISDAIDHATAHGTVVISEGVYHETVSIPETKPGLVVRAAPGATVWLDGSAPVSTDIIHQDGTWRVLQGAPTLDRSPTYERGAPDGRREGWRWVAPEYPLASDPQQVWLDDAPLRQVSPASAVAPGTFAVDGRDIVLGDDPAGHEVRIGSLGRAMIVHGDGARVEGLGIRRYVPSVPDFGAVVLDAPNTAMADVVVADSSTTGVSVQNENVTLDGVTVIRAGLLGVQAHQAHGLTIRNGAYTHNNARAFNMAPNAGGIKITFAADVTVTGSTIAHNLGNGLWLDEGVGSSRIADVEVHGNSLHGILIELCAQVDVVMSSLYENDGVGLRFQNSSGARVWNVTSSHNSRAIDFVQDGRTAGSSEAPPVPQDPRLPEMTWVIGDSEVVNTVLGPSTGDADLAVEDFRTQLDADRANITLRSNVYVRDEVGRPRWTHVWTRPDHDPWVYETVAAFSRAHGQDVNSVLATAGGVPGGMQAEPMPTEMRPRDGVAPPPGIGSPN